MNLIIPNSISLAVIVEQMGFVISRFTKWNLVVDIFPFPKAAAKQSTGTVDEGPSALSTTLAKGVPRVGTFLSP